MNFQPDALIALAFLAPVAAFAIAEILAVAPRRLEPSFVAAAPVRTVKPATVDVTAKPANDEWMREAA